MAHVSSVGRMVKAVKLPPKAASISPTIEENERKDNQNQSTEFLRRYDMSDRFVPEKLTLKHARPLAYQTVFSQLGPNGEFPFNVSHGFRLRVGSDLDLAKDQQPLRQTNFAGRKAHAGGSTKAREVVLTSQCSSVPNDHSPFRLTSKLEPKFDTKANRRHSKFKWSPPMLPTTREVA